jgi:hypothetical protein
MPELQPSEEELTNFEAAIIAACVLQSESPLEHATRDLPRVESLVVPSYFRSRDGALVVSFDKGWQPFLDNTRGYNQGPQRWYIPKTSKLLAQVAHELQTSRQRRYADQPGCRVFLDFRGVCRRPEGYEEVEVLRWRLPRSSAFLRPRQPPERPRDSGTVSPRRTR